MVRVATALAADGVSVVTFDFPYVGAGRKRPDQAPVLERVYGEIWQQLTRDMPSHVRWFAGGKSMGGRIASQVAAADGFQPRPAGLIFFGYPLHPPDAPSKRRDAHLPRINRPMLFLHGTRDPFGTADEMRELTHALPASRLHLVDGGDHSLQRSRRWESVDEAVGVAAEWIRARSRGQRTDMITA
jgi:predicted alpha/beta-hydrolase family hydrolase